MTRATRMHIKIGKITLEHIFISYRGRKIGRTHKIGLPVAAAQARVARKNRGFEGTRAFEQALIQSGNAAKAPAGRRFIGQ